jgi:aspartyl-tRNA(Asn)/glutamyl-tRNA(Gln) amidotransferase subunit A
MTIREIGRLLRRGETCCVELVERTFDEIRERERFHSFITRTEERARAQAAELDRELRAGHDRGPLHGIPTAHKDLFYTAGIRTTGGSLVFGDFVPDCDATAVGRLHAAGAISIGKTNLHELAYGITSKNPHYGHVLNPRDPARMAGGSSGGSAALVAAGFVPFSLGTDTAGSIRIPASFCGVTGFKPTYERVSRHGVLPLAFGLDHVGPIGSCVEDCALVMDAIAEGEFGSPALGDFAGIRAGMPTNYFFDAIDDEVETAVRGTVSKMQENGARVVELRVPDMDVAYRAARLVQMPETAALYAHYADPSLFGRDVWTLIQQGKLIAGHEYVNAQRLRNVFRREMDEIWKQVDVLVTPTTPIAAPLLEDEAVEIKGQKKELRAACTSLVRPINYFGEPALSMPCGQTAGGLPIGIQLIAAPFEDTKLLQIAATLERLLA